jgi:hypothetical protein
MHESQQKTAHEPLPHNTTTSMNMHVLFDLVGVCSLDYYPTCLLCGGSSSLSRPLLLFAFPLGGGGSSSFLRQLYVLNVLVY